MRLSDISSRATALVATLAVLVAASVVADHLGAAAAVIEAVALVLVIAALALAAAMTRTMRPSNFHMAGRRLGWLRSIATAATVGLGMALTARTPDVSAAGHAAAGLLLAAIIYAGPLHRAGAPGLGAFALARYRSRALCLAAGGATLALCLALMHHAGRIAAWQLADLVPISPGWASATISATALAMLLPGGMISVAAAAVIALLVILAGYGLPMLVLAARADALAAGAATLVAGQLTEIVFSPWVAAAAAGLVAATGLTLPVRTAARSRRTLAAAALLVLAVIGVAAMVPFAVSLATASIGDQKVDSLPTSIYAPAARGIVTVCGVSPTDQDTLRRACAAINPSGIVPAAAVSVKEPAPRWTAISLELPIILGAIHAIAPILALIALLAAMARAAAGALIGEILYPLVNRTGTASGRLAMHRIAMPALFGGLGAWEAFVQPRAALPASVDGQSVFMLMMIAVCVPAVIILPARFRSVDWRAPAAGLMAAAAFLAATAVNALQAQLALVGVCTALATTAAAMLLRSKDAADSRAADIVTGRIAGPIVHYQDA